MNGVGSPQNNDSAPTLSSMQTRTPSSCGKCRTKFTPNGLLVSARKRRISSRRRAGGQSCAWRMPKPPALLTAATNSTPVRSGPMGATTIGASMPKRSQKRVLSITHTSRQRRSEPSCCPQSTVDRLDGQAELVLFQRSFATQSGAELPLRLAPAERRLRVETGCPRGALPRRTDGPEQGNQPRLQPVKTSVPRYLASQFVEAF